MKDAITKTFTYGGRRYYVRAKTEKEAIEKMVKKKLDLQNGNYVVNGDTTVSAWAYKCIDVYKTNQSPATRTTYISRLNSCILSQIGNRPLKSIKPFDCQMVLNRLQGQSNYQISAVCQILKFIFGKAKINHLISEDPTLDLQKPCGTKKKRRALTPAEENAFLSVAFSTPQFRVFLLMYFCGLRTSEARNARYDDIIYIKDGDTEYPALHVRGTKTANAVRNVPIPNKLLKAIEKPAKSSYIAPNAAGNKHTDNSFKRAISSLRRAMNIAMGCRVYRNQLIPPFPLAEDFVPYCLRHTYCSNLCKAGVDIRVAQSLMGHSDITLTANIYTHTDNSSLIAAARKLEDFSCPSN